MTGGSPAYRIGDSPRPWRADRFATNPFFILLLSAFLLPLIGPPWFLANSFAMGSPRLLREFLITVAGVAGFAAIVAGYLSIPYFVEGFSVTKPSLQPYLSVAFKGYWIGLCYILFVSQMRFFAVFQYFEDRKKVLLGEG